jgi:hypothetical protein
MFFTKILTAWLRRRNHVCDSAVIEVDIVKQDGYHPQVMITTMCPHSKIPLAITRCNSTRATALGAQVLRLARQVQICVERDAQPPEE